MNFLEPCRNIKVLSGSERRGEGQASQKWYIDITEGAVVGTVMREGGRRLG